MSINTSASSIGARTRVVLHSRRTRVEPACTRCTSNSRLNDRHQRCSQLTGDSQVHEPRQVRDELLHRTDRRRLDLPWLRAAGHRLHQHESVRRLRKLLFACNHRHPAGSSRAAAVDCVAANCPLDANASCVLIPTVDPSSSMSLPMRRHSAMS